MDFGLILKEVRRNKNLSQRQVADKLGVDFKFISSIENNRTIPNENIIIRLSYLYDIPNIVLLTIYKIHTTKNELNNIL